LLNLILNENMKIYRRLRTWILVAILLVIEGLAFFLNYYHQPLGRSLWEGANFASNLIIVALFLAVIIAADSVAGEFSGGTIKLLLIRPASRAKILLSKYISVLAFLLFMLIVLLVTSLIISGLMFGFDASTGMYNYTGKGGLQHEISWMAQTFRSYGFGCINLIMILSMAFMLSTVFRSSAIAISISIVSIFVGGIVGALIMRFSWAKYYLFLNTDLSVYLTDQIPIRNSGMTLGFSIIVLLIYFVIFNGLSWFVFKKRDVSF
jgi:ABC-2 type transport system permease protein